MSAPAGRGTAGHVQLGAGPAGLGQHPHRADDTGHADVLGRARRHPGHQRGQLGEIVGACACCSNPIACHDDPGASRPSGQRSDAACRQRDPPPARIGRDVRPKAVTASAAGTPSWVWPPSTGTRHACEARAMPAHDPGQQRAGRRADRVQQTRRRSAHRGQVVDVDQHRTPPRPLRIAFHHGRDDCITRGHEVAAGQRHAVVADETCRDRDRRAPRGAAQGRRRGTPWSRRPAAASDAAASASRRAVGPPITHSPWSSQPSEPNIAAYRRCTVASKRSTPADSA